MIENCSTCICKEGSCYPSLTIFDKDKTCKSYMPDYEGYIADLEKENAELKILRCCENCKNVNLQLHWRESEEIDKRRQFVCGTCGNRKHWEYLGKTVGITETQQLTKAKEIIREIMKYEIPTLDYEKAEQFLKEIEK